MDSARLDGLVQDAAPLPEPFFPEDFAKTYTEVRNCRRSIDHDLKYIVVMADALAVGPYVSRKKPFPPGSTVVKREFSDELCTKATGYTAMQKQAADEASHEASKTGGWLFQRVTLDRVVYDDAKTLKRCVTCHEDCGVKPDGYDWTCAVP